MTVTDHETTVLDDLDFEVPCENPHCDDAAEWVLRWRGMPCCTPLYLVCTSCLEDTRQWLSRAKAAGGLGDCRQHGFSFPIAHCQLNAEPLNPS